MPFILSLAEPRVPNGLALDAPLGAHHGDQLELVHAHTVGLYAGAVRVHALRSRARLATYADALAAAPAGTAPSLDGVPERDRVKAGVGLDVEQRVAADVGLFARVHVTADFQRVANPGYNMDRGPASFCALRLHWEV